MLFYLFYYSSLFEHVHVLFWVKAVVQMENQKNNRAEQGGQEDVIRKHNQSRKRTKKPGEDVQMTNKTKQKHSSSSLTSPRLVSLLLNADSLLITKG